MQAKLHMLFITSILVAAFTAAVLLPVGCQPDRAITTATGEPYPVCSHVTRVQPLTGLEYTTCICPSCRKVLTVNEDIIPELLRFTGPNVGESVTVCDGCGVILEECAVCREARGK